MRAKPLGQGLRPGSWPALVLAAQLSALAGAGTVTYTYDDLGRLKTVNQNGQFIQYGLDGAGNRTAVSSAETAAPSVPIGLAVTATAAAAAAAAAR